VPTTPTDRRFLRWLAGLTLAGLALIALGRLIETKD
jgi:hypothetical protein